MSNIKLITFVLSYSKIAPITQGKATVLSELRRLFACMAAWISILFHAFSTNKKQSTYMIRFTL